MVANHLVKIVVPSQILHVARRAISTVVLKFLHFMGGLSCALIKTLIFVQVCDCAAHYGQFGKHCFNHCEDCLMIAPVECRNMWVEILYVLCVYIPVYVKLDL